MSRLMVFSLCVVGVVAVLSSADALQATTIYNANEDMYASEKEVTPGTYPGTNGFGGVWSLGSRADDATGTAFTLFANHETPRDGSAGWLGWDSAAGGFPYFAVNTSTAAFDWGWYRNGATDMGIKDIGINPDVAVAGVLRWTAPGAGTISTATIINAGVGPDTYGGIDIHLLLNGVSKYDNAFTMDAGVAISTSDLTVAAGDVLDLIIGDGGNGNWYDLSGITSHVVTFTAVPEPSSIGLLGCGGMGLLAYAWRKRRS